MVCLGLLLQMLIKGIRSFAPENNAAIEFYKPLTLIVGSNGAGKTVRTVLSACG
jgi:DNA repair protein RAD50